MSPATHLTLTEAAARLRTGTLSSEALVGACLDRAEALNGTLNAFVAIEREDALARARRLDADRAAGRIHGPLHGVPLAHKDMFYRAGKVTGCGSAVRRDFTPATTSSLVARLEAAGAVTIGRLHMAEFAMGPTGHNAHLGRCANPFAPDHITGGSSSGSGAAVAARCVFGALGSDTGGSVRLPAAMCGVAGLKPTQGLLADDGMMGLSESLDCAGPLARSSRDLATLMAVMTGVDCSSALDRPLAGLTLGLPTRFYYEGLDAPVAAALDAARDTFARLGARIVDVEVPDQERLGDLANLVWTPEAAALHLPWLRTTPEAYGAQVRARLLQGLSLPATRYIEARRLRTLCLADMLDGPLAACDALLVPAMRRTVPTAAATDVAAGGAMASVLADISALTRPLSYLGLPGLVTPAGFDGAGLPIGLQLIGRPRSEGLLMGLGDAFERETAFIHKAPPL